MAESALKPMTPEEFFQWQLDQEERYELIDGSRSK
jgi:Uma2 family endonuclease